jgi:hypothetical protein
MHRKNCSRSVLVFADCDRNTIPQACYDDVVFVWEDVDFRVCFLNGFSCWHLVQTRYKIYHRHASIRSILVSNNIPEAILYID